MYELSPISERVERTRAKYRDTVPYVDTTRYRLVTEFYMSHRNLSGNMRRALNFKNLCENLPCVIHEDELIIGSYTTTYKATALYPENSIDWLIDEIKTESLWTRELDPYQITEEDKEYILSTADYWLGECMNSKMDPYIPKNYADNANNGVLYFTATGICPQPVGHFCPNYQKVIREGMTSVKEEAERKILELEEKGLYGSDARKYCFYMGIVAVCEGMITLAKRYSRECARRAEEEADPKRKAELERMADTMNVIMDKPCRDFRDAIQAVWFYQMCVLMDANMHGTSVGRIDQYVGDFAERDLAAGKITREEMQEIVDMYYLKVAECNKVWSARTVRSAPGYTSGQLITLGGTDKDGNDATNIITYMGLEAVGRMVLHSPPQALRVHKGTPDKLWDCALTVNKIAGGVPSFFADESIIPALMNRGVSLEDARNYCLIGCVEPSVGGSEWPACGGVGINSYMNFANVFLLAVNNGKNPKPNMDGTPKTEQFGPETGYLRDMTSIEEVMAAYKTQMEYWIKWNVILDNIFEEVNRIFLPQPVVSSTMVGCMEKGMDVVDGGAKYNSTGLSGIGLGNVTDCFSMIENVVFKEKKCTMAELHDALLNNWEGHEELHEYILGHKMHYGNGIEAVDKYAKWIADEYADCVNSKTGPRGHFAAGMFPVTMNVVYGMFTAATPDGRMSGAPLSDGISACQGMDKSGPTAILNSVGVFDQSKFSNGTLLNMKFHPLTLASEDGFTKLKQLMQVYFFHKGGMEMQLNIVSADTLRDAQAHPENYKDLVVRIAGFSAYFVDVYKAAQDDLIKRTELSM